MKFHSEVEEDLWSMAAWCRTNAKEKTRKFIMLIYYYWNDLSDKYHLEYADEAMEFLEGLSDSKPGVLAIKEDLRPKIEMWIQKNQELF